MSKVMYDFKVEEGKLQVSVGLDLNEDGQPVVKNTTEIDIAEIPDEVLSAIVQKKSEAKA